MRTKITSLHRLKAGPGDGLGEREFTAYASTWTRTPDAYGDVVAPGAFTDTIAEWEASGNVVPILYGHRTDDPAYNVGGAQQLQEDGHGLLVHGRFDDTPTAEQVYNLVKGRRLGQLSFAFDTQEEVPITLPGGVKANELRRLRLYEVSLVPVGANQDTGVVAVKHQPRWTTADLDLRLRITRALG